MQLIVIFPRNPFSKLHYHYGILKGIIKEGFWGGDSRRPTLNVDTFGANKFGELCLCHIGFDLKRWSWKKIEIENLPEHLLSIIKNPINLTNSINKIRQICIKSNEYICSG